MSMYSSFQLSGGSDGPPPAKKQNLGVGVKQPSIFALEDEDGGKKSNKSDESRRLHCEVEKKRRDKMNYYMCELATMIPACSEVPRKLDKLSILKMAVEHMKKLRGDPYVSQDDKPGFLSDVELKKLLVEAASGFMIIISCSNGQILYASDTLQDVLGEAPEEWVGTCIYDMLHTKDVEKVKEQLQCFNINDTLQSCTKAGMESSTVVLQGQSMNGLRRSFLCRIKLKDKSQSQDIEQPDGMSDDATVNYNHSIEMIRLMHTTKQAANSNQQYCILHCSGFIRELVSSEKSLLNVDEEGPSQCLVAIARKQPLTKQQTAEQQSDGIAPTPSGSNEFVARVKLDGKFSYVDNRVLSVLGYVPQDLIGEVCYQYYHPDDLHKMAQLHQNAIKYSHTPMPTVQYRFLSKNQKWVWLAGKAFCFVNPYSQQVEYIIITNVLISQQAENHGVVEAFLSQQQTQSQHVASSHAGNMIVDMTSGGGANQNLGGHLQGTATHTPSLMQMTGSPVIGGPSAHGASVHNGRLPGMADSASGLGGSRISQAFHNGRGAFPVVPQANNSLMFGNNPTISSSAEPSIGTQPVDSGASMPYLPGLTTAVGQPTVPALSNDVILNLLKEYESPEQIGRIFEHQQLGDPYNIQMSLPNMDIFD